MFRICQIGHRNFDSSRVAEQIFVLARVDLDGIDEDIAEALLHSKATSKRAATHLHKSHNHHY